MRKILVPLTLTLTLKTLIRHLCAFQLVSVFLSNLFPVTVALIHHVVKTVWPAWQIIFYFAFTRRLVGLGQTTVTVVY